MLKKFSLCSLFLIVACGNPQLKDKRELQQKKEKAGKEKGRPAFAISGFELGLNKDYRTPWDYAVYPNLSTVLNENQLAHYDEEKGEGKLTFGLTLYDGLTSYYVESDRSMLRCDSAYLYTKADQRQLGYPYDNQKAAIFLKTKAGQSLEVGRYLPNLDFGPIASDSPWRISSLYHWTHPVLCSGPYASICEVKVATRPAADGKSFGQMGIELWIKGEKEAALRMESAEASENSDLQAIRTCKFFE